MEHLEDRTVLDAVPLVFAEATIDAEVDPALFVVDTTSIAYLNDVVVESIVITRTDPPGDNSVLSILGGALTLAPAPLVAPVMVEEDSSVMSTDAAFATFASPLVESSSRSTANVAPAATLPMTDDDLLLLEGRYITATMEESDASVSFMDEDSQESSQVLSLYKSAFDEW